MLKTCVDCGDSFEVEPGEFWKTRCIDCWLEKKQESDGARRTYASSWVRTARHDVQDADALRRQIDDLRRRNRRLLFDLARVTERLDRDSVLIDELYDQLPRLIQLTHPDRHDGSPASHKATQWLLQVRRLAPVTEEGRS